MKKLVETMGVDPLELLFDPIMGPDNKILEDIESYRNELESCMGVPDALLGRRSVVARGSH